MGGLQGELQQQIGKLKKVRVLLLHNCIPVANQKATSCRTHHSSHPLIFCTTTLFKNQAEDRKLAEPEMKNGGLLDSLAASDLLVRNLSKRRQDLRPDDTMNQTGTWAVDATESWQN